MTFARNDDEAALMSEINMTPLVDVMLVLLIIFLVTLPVVHHAVKVQLPKANSQPEEAQPARIDLTIRADGTTLWNQEYVNEAALQTYIERAAARQPQPELRIYADRAVRYQYVATVMAAAQAKGLSKMGFVTETKPLGVVLNK